MKQFYFGSSGSMFALQVVIENVIRDATKHFKNHFKMFLHDIWLAYPKKILQLTGYGRICQPIGLGLSVTSALKLCSVRQKY